MKLYIIIVFFFIAGTLTAQEQLSLKLLNTTLASGAEQMPFWLHANRNGKIPEDAAIINLTEARFSQSASLFKSKQFNYFAGCNLIAGTGDQNYFKANQLFAGINYKNWNLKAGWFQNPLKYNGISSTNGDIHWSNNIRPMPRIQLSADFIRFSFLPSWFSIKGLYEEAWLNDNNRYVKHARLHHKNIFVRFDLSIKSSFVMGLDHYSQWGGVHPVRGQLPAGFNDYVRYVLGLPGSEEFSKSDQNLMAGNQLGKYVIEYNQQFSNATLEIYLNHPFTDRMDWSNYKDNLLGVCFTSEKKRIITHILYEFMYTKYQRAILMNGKYTVPGGGSEPYFRHGTYRSGLSYKNRMFVTPFAIPLVIMDGINYGTGNNRIILHHIGASGTLTDQMTWKGLLSFSNIFGTFGNIYNNIQPGFFDLPRKQISLYGELNYKFKNKHWQSTLAVAADKGNLMKDNAGIQLTFIYKLL